MTTQFDVLFSQSRGTDHPLPAHPIASLLYDWLIPRLTDSGITWLDSVIPQLLKAQSERMLFARFSEAPRRVGKLDLAPTDSELDTAKQLCPGWDPTAWSLDQVTRSLLLLLYSPATSQDYVATLKKVLEAADVAEQVAWYQSLPLFPFADQFRDQAIDGLRSNMKAVFDAIALHNPYPAQYFDELAWNQMVLKALFIESPLSQIQGLDDRANAELARMLIDYAHERWAAGRPVNLQLWRLVGPFTQAEHLSDLNRVISHPATSEQQAAALACNSSQNPQIRALVETVPHIQQNIQDSSLTWAQLSQSHP